METFFLVTFLTVAAQFITIRLITGEEWFPIMPVWRATLIQGAIALLLALFVGTVLSSGLWLLAFIIPSVFQQVEAALPLADGRPASGLKWGLILNFLISFTPFLYLIIRMVGQVRTRRAREAWQAGPKGPTL